ncbi:hypothetical protein N752_00500 [Desulforamulus aquiferis]|nr:hypothetical protein N752_00500 [Desulforamulus aquiferis]
MKPEDLEDMGRDALKEELLENPWRFIGFVKRNLELKPCGKLSG